MNDSASLSDQIPSQYGGDVHLEGGRAGEPTVIAASPSVAVARKLAAWCIPAPIAAPLAAIVFWRRGIAMVGANLFS